MAMVPRLRALVTGFLQVLLMDILKALFKITASALESLGSAVVLTIARASRLHTGLQVKSWSLTPSLKTKP